MGTALLLYPNQLFELEALPKVQRVYLIEDPLFFGGDPERVIFPHKQRLVLHRASMRRYAEEVLWPAGYEVEYIEWTRESTSDTGLVRAAFDGASEVYFFDPIDTLLSARLEAASRALEVHVPLRKLEHPHFYLKSTDVKHFFADFAAHDFDNFYQWQRERFNILIDEKYRPVGGKLRHEPTARASKISPPGLHTFGDNAFVEEAILYVEKNFSAYPGELTNFVWPTNHAEAGKWFEAFLEERLASYGSQLDKLDSQSSFGFCSALSPMLNTGLLRPMAVVEGTLDFAAVSKQTIPLDSLEGFIRRVIGWREYMRAMYQGFGDKHRSSNELGAHAQLGDVWWNGQTGLAPYDTVVRKLKATGYATAVERSRVVGAALLLSDIDPAQVYQFVMSFFIDAYDWVVVPNVYSASQFAAGAVFSDVPMVQTSAWFMAQGYQKEPWCDIWDGLYWRCIENHRAVFARTRTGKLLVSRLDRLDPARRRVISYRAADFLAASTHL